MACTKPLAAWYAKEPNPDTGKTPVVFTFAEADTSRPIQLACGRCIACRIDRGAQWGQRIMQEAKMHRESWFVTLTYDDERLPKTAEGLPTLRPEDMVLFMKRLRRRIDGKLRYYQAGEYGEITSRPHHHAILFGLQVPDAEPLTARAGAHARYFRSHLLEDTWSHGTVILGGVTQESANYVARYVTKKVTGDLAPAHYRGRVPEYATMSRRPGIGRPFLEKYLADIYPADEVAIAGTDKTRKPPRYYDATLERIDQELHQEVMQARLIEPRRQRSHRELAATDAKLNRRFQLYRKKEPGLE